MTFPPLLVLLFHCAPFIIIFSLVVSLSLYISSLSGAEMLPQAVGYRENKKERKRKKEMGVV